VTAEPPVPLVWLGPHPADLAQSSALAGWARAHGVTLVVPADERPPSIAMEARAAADTSEDIERRLDRVRDAVAGHDGEGADRELAAAESALRAHPELPQASWLMAEVERARSSRFRRVPPIDEEAAERSWLRAEALDGGRVAGVGEHTAATPPADATIAFEPLPAGATLRLDGHVEPLGSATVATRAGPHALVVAWDETPVWAGWIDTPPGSSALHLAIPGAPPCSVADLGLARAPEGESGGVVDATGVRCASWVAALAGGRPESVRVASCEAARCGVLLDWRPPGSGGWTWKLPPERTRAGWPGWATWGLVGAGAVIATTVVVVASGVLQAPPGETRFVSGGVKAQ
jgi:hypothetical protein